MDWRIPRSPLSPKPWALTGALALAVLFSATPLAAAGAAGAGQAIPPSLAVPSGQFTPLQLAAEGVQIYTCQATADTPSAFSWVFRAPEATLHTAQGELVGRHYAGPTWEGLDGSLVMGAASASADSPDPEAIPWLLLEARSSAGSGVFSTVTYVQRLDTQGGRAPADGCGTQTLGQEARVPYTATYAFSYPVAAMP